RIGSWTLPVWCQDSAPERIRHCRRRDVERPQRTRRHVFSPGEAMLLIKVCRRRVLRRRVEPTAKLPLARLSRLLGHVRQESGFHGASNDAAAQKEVLYFRTPAGDVIPRDHRSHKTAIAETVVDRDGQYAMARPISKRCKLLLIVAASRRI